MDNDVCMMEAGVENVNMFAPNKPLMNNAAKMQPQRAFGTNLTNAQPMAPSQPQQQQKQKQEPQQQLLKKPLKMDTGNANICDSNEWRISDEEYPIWDRKDLNDELCVVPYLRDIMGNLYGTEARNNWNADYMSRQENINARMRLVLLDWIIEVHRKFDLLPPTLHLCVNLLDRYLGQVPVHRKKLQLIGCACLWVSGKYHEIYAPEVDDFVYISDSAFTREDLIAMEGEIVSKLEFELTVPTGLSFAQRFIKFATFNFKKDSEKRIITDLVHYCIEHALIDYELSNNLPSQIAAMALCYAVCATKIIHSKTQWDHIFVGKFGVPHTFESLMPLMSKLDSILKLNAKECKHKAVRKKYTSSKLSKVALMSFSKLNLAALG